MLEREVRTLHIVQPEPAVWGFPDVSLVISHAKRLQINGLAGPPAHRGRTQAVLPVGGGAAERRSSARFAEADAVGPPGGTVGTALTNAASTVVVRFFDAVEGLLGLSPGTARLRLSSLRFWKP